MSDANGRDQGVIPIELAEMVAHTRLEVFQTECTTVVQPEELGWLGIISSQACGPSALLRCMVCQRIVLADRLHVHLQQCAAAAAAAAKPKSSPSADRGGSMPAKRTTKPKKQKAAELAWDPPRARTNLSKVTYPYEPELTLVDDFMDNLIDRLVFPPHLKRQRAGMLARRRRTPPYTLLTIDSTEGGQLGSIATTSAVPLPPPPPPLDQGREGPPSGAFVVQPHHPLPDRPVGQLARASSSVPVGVGGMVLAGPVPVPAGPFPIPAGGHATPPRSLQQSSSAPGGSSASMAAVPIKRPMGLFQKAEAAKASDGRLQQRLETGACDASGTTRLSGRQATAVAASGPVGSRWAGPQLPGPKRSRSGGSSGSEGDEGLILRRSVPAGVRLVRTASGSLLASATQSSSHDSGRRQGGGLQAAGGRLVRQPSQQDASGHAPPISSRAASPPVRAALPPVPRTGPGSGRKVARVEGALARPDLSNRPMPNLQLKDGFAEAAMRPLGQDANGPVSVAAVGAAARRRSDPSSARGGPRQDGTACGAKRMTSLNALASQDL